MSPTVTVKNLYTLAGKVSHALNATVSPVFAEDGERYHIRCDKLPAIQPDHTLTQREAWYYLNGLLVGTLAGPDCPQNSEGPVTYPTRQTAFDTNVSDESGE